LLFEFLTDFCLGAGSSGTESTTITGDCGAPADGPADVAPGPVAVPGPEWLDPFVLVWLVDVSGG